MIFVFKKIDDIAFSNQYVNDEGLNRIPSGFVCCLTRDIC